MKYAIISNNLQDDGTYEEELFLIVSAQSANEALWRAGINAPTYGRYYEAVPAQQYAAHFGGRYDAASYMSAP
jgi:hypothetical protein